jgi:AcrR family transcriptional regulator
MKTVAELEEVCEGNEPFEPKRGRPSASQSAAIERSIREAATQAFLSSGYERTSMEAVAAQAGIPKSTLYKRFPDKRALLRAVLSDRVAAWCDMERKQGPNDDLELRLKLLATDILHHATTPEVQAFWSLVSTAWSDPADARERQDAIGYTKMMDGLEQEIREFGPASGITARDPRQVATTLMAMLGGWIEYVAPTVAVQDEEAERFAHASVDILMRGVAAW